MIFLCKKFKKSINIKRDNKSTLVNTQDQFIVLILLQVFINKILMQISQETGVFKQVNYFLKIKILNFIRNLFNQL